MLATVLLGATAWPASSQHLEQDGVTARTWPNGLVDQHFRRDAEGNYSLRVIIYQKVAGEWTQVAMPATLRIFEYVPDVVASTAVDPTAPSVSAQAHVSTDGWRDRLSLPFVSSDSEPVQLKFSPAILGNPTILNPKPFDLFITFAGAGLEGHTSHHGILKNELIMTGDANPSVRAAAFDAADALDYTGTMYPIAA